MFITTYNYDLEQPICIHDAFSAFQNAKKQLFKAPTPYGIDMSSATTKNLMLEVCFASKSGIAALEVKVSSKADPYKFLIFHLPVLQAIDTELFIGYGVLAGHIIRDLVNRNALYASMGLPITDKSPKPFDLIIEDDELEDAVNELDGVIAELLEKYPEIYSDPLDGLPSKEDVNVALPNFTRLATLNIDFGYKKQQIELTIGVHEGKLTGTFTVFMNWSTDEDEESIENYRFPMPENLNTVNSQRLISAMNNFNNCADAITVCWDEDFGEDAEVEDFIQAVLKELNPITNYLNGIKTFYAV